MKRFAKIREFVGDDRGGVLVEFLIILPLLIWTWIALVVFWDVYSTINTAQKAAYSISDLISRQEDNLTPEFIDGMQDVFDFLMVNRAREGSIRISSFIYDEDEDEYISIFSVSPDGKVLPYTETQLQTLRDRVPLMGDTDSVVLVETFVEYVFPFRIPFIDAGVAVIDENAATRIMFDEFVVTRPRFKNYICLEDPGCPIL
jgi:hypothetical protein